MTSSVTEDTSVEMGLLEREGEESARPTGTVEKHGMVIKTLNTKNASIFEHVKRDNTRGQD